MMPKEVQDEIIIILIFKKSIRRKEVKLTMPFGFSPENSIMSNLSGWPRRKRLCMNL